MTKHSEPIETEGRTVLVAGVFEYSPFSTVVTFHGTDADTGEEIHFHADRRPADAIIAAIEAGEDPEAFVPDWAVSRVISTTPEVQV